MLHNVVKIVIGIRISKFTKPPQKFTPDLVIFYPFFAFLAPKPLLRHLGETKLAPKPCLGHLGYSKPSSETVPRTLR